MTCNAHRGPLDHFLHVKQPPNRVQESLSPISTKRRMPNEDAMAISIALDFVDFIRDLRWKRTHARTG